MTNRPHNWISARIRWPAMTRVQVSWFLWLQTVQNPRANSIFADSVVAFCPLFIALFWVFWLVAPWYWAWNLLRQIYGRLTQSHRTCCRWRSIELVLDQSECPISGECWKCVCSCNRVPAENLCLICQLPNSLVKKRLTNLLLSFHSTAYFVIQICSFHPSNHHHHLPLFLLYLSVLLTSSSAPRLLMIISDRAISLLFFRGAFCRIGSPRL